MAPWSLDAPRPCITLLAPREADGDMTDAFGPFSVDPGQVAGLSGALFQELMNRLLAAEVTAAGLSATSLRTSYQANVRDQGVDALIESAQQTEWVPAGNSAWQFKAGDLGPESCAKELEDATFAHEILRAGGAYRLVLGKGMEAHLIAAREAKLREKAAELGFEATADRFMVIDGNQLARWVERYPALAVSRVLRATGRFAIGFDSWTRKSKHRYTWVESAESNDLGARIIEFLGQRAKTALRIEGVSGLGKSRGTLESLRGSAYEPLVVYVPDASEINSAIIDHLTLQNRSAVLVVDECDRNRHKVFAEQLEVDSPVRLITIGPRDTSVPQFQPLGVSKLPNDTIEKVLSGNFLGLWPEARRLVIENCAGNVGWALYLAEAILNNPKANAADLIDAAGLRDFILSMVASDGDFLAVSALALLTRYGVDGEKEAELEMLAAGLDIPVEQLKAASQRLDQQGLLIKHGRYRAVGPQPLAVLLASSAWEALGDRIVESLLPSMHGSMAERLLLRAADIGSSGPAAVALNKLLEAGGPFGSLDSIATEATSRLLIQLAIIAPVEVTSHLEQLIAAASDEELRGLKAIRRNLVWTLEKLVWHSETFESAADMLLRLALCENETFSNNATGTWVSLFGAMLPATAARPAERLRYLQALADDPLADVRKLAVAAADHALDAHSTVMVSGELQGGVVVEPRGTPNTWGEVWDYQKSTIELLSQRASDDTDEAIREAATKALIDAIHPFLETKPFRDTLFDALAALPDDARRRVWTEVNHLGALFDRVETPEFTAATNTAHDVTGRRAGLEVLITRLPAPDEIDELKVLADARRWEWEDGQLQRRIISAAQALPATDANASLLELASTVPPPEAAFEIGAALYTVAASQESVEKLAALADGPNVASLTGYLYESQRDGHPDAFNDFLDSPTGESLTPTTRLTLTVRGPKSARGWQRVMVLQKMLPVCAGALGMFGWHIDVEPEHMASLLAEWTPRIESQQDYNAAVDVAAMMTFRKPELSEEIEAQIAALVELREQFGEVGQQSYDWIQLAGRRLSRDARGLLAILLKQIEAGAILTYDGSQEQDFLREVIGAAGPESLVGLLQLIQGGSWRLQMDFRGWLTSVYESATLIEWIGSDLERARVIASLTGVNDGPPSEIVKFLLTEFGDDDQVTSPLYGDFISGSWWGNESDRLNGQIAQMTSWLNDRALAEGVKSWVREVIARLKRRLEVALVQEAEGER